MKNLTFTIIKPNAVAAGNLGKILDMIIEDGFKVCAMRMTTLSRSDAERFYAIHRERPFFRELVDFMTSGAVVVAVLGREDAVAALRRLVGATNPAEAAEGTIRKLFAESLTKNAIHAADSDENAEVEWSQFFSADQIIS